MKIRKTFYYEEIELRIVEREEPYMNGGSVTMTRVLAPNGEQIPVQLQRKQTLKSIVEQTLILLDGFKSRGADVKTELTKEL